MGIFVTSGCSRILKDKIYYTVVKSALTYGSECSPLSNEGARMVMHLAPIELKLVIKIALVWPRDEKATYISYQSYWR